MNIVDGVTDDTWRLSNRGMKRIRDVVVPVSGELVGKKISKILRKFRWLRMIAVVEDVVDEVLGMGQFVKMTKELQIALTRVMGWILDELQESTDDVSYVVGVHAVSKRQRQ